MRLKEKTHRKFADFFEKLSKMHHGEEFELSYSDIQRETGAASVTLKRAIQALAEDGVIDVHPGRNSRYARFRYLLPVQKSEEECSQVVLKEKRNLKALSDEKKPQHSETLVAINQDVTELTQHVDHLRRRVRNQEMAIALLQDRLAEIEDIMRKR